jgi:hypothetical protein
MGDFLDCPSNVDGFLAVLESQFDSEFTIETFEPHLENFDLSVPEGQLWCFFHFTILIPQKTMAMPRHSNASITTSSGSRAFLPKNPCGSPPSTLPVGPF